MLFKKTESFMFVPVLSFSVYITAYLGRINLSITIPYLQNELGYSKAVLGLLASGFFCTYAVGQLINGILGDRIQVRFFVTIGLLVAGISNIAFGIIRSFPLMFLAWSANGYFQSMLWGPLLRGISESVPHNKLRQAMLLMSISPIVGHFAAYILAGQLAIFWKWEIAFLIPGVLLIAAALSWYWIMPRIAEKIKKDRTDTTAVNVKKFSIKQLAVFFISKKLHLMVLLGIFVGIIKEGLTLWSPVFFIESYSMEMDKMIYIMSFMPLVNLVFILLGGLLIKKCFPDENYTILLFLIFTLLPVILIWKIENMIFPLVVLCFYGLMASIYTVNTQMVSFFPINFRDNGQVSSSAGIIDSSIYLGAVIAGPLIGMASEKYGWNGMFLGIMGICLAAFVPVFFLLKKTSIEKNNATA